MKKLSMWLKKSRFLIFLLIFFLVLDYLALVWGNSLIPKGICLQNDFETTRYAHPEKVWDKVIFGSSDLMTGFREDLSTSGYINMGIDSGVVTDLAELLRDGYITVGSELVVELDLLTLYDDFMTDPTDIWHRKPWEPYTYFHRDKLYAAAKLLAREALGYDVTAEKTPREKRYGYGCMSDEELREKQEKLQAKYYCLPESAFRENIAALDTIADWCEDHGVRLRLLWTPANPAVETPKLNEKLYRTVEEWSLGRGIELHRFGDVFPPECFYDITHFNYEYGAYVFTEELDKWL